MNLDDRGARSPHMTTTTLSTSLEAHRSYFRNSPFLAMPIAGTLAWAAIGVAGLMLPQAQAVWAVYIGTGMIFYLGLVVARFTGEDLLGRRRKGNPFDALFMRSVLMAWLVFAIAIPFARVDPTSLPLTVGILAGLMWLPFGWIIQHWVGTFHAVTRTVLCLAAWYAFPDQRFVVIPLVIVAIYLVSIVALTSRFRAFRVPD
jgi:ethanolamine transporter EutH